MLEGLPKYFDILPSDSKKRSVVVFTSDDASNEKLQLIKNSAENMDLCNTEVIFNNIKLKKKIKLLNKA